MQNWTDERRRSHYCKAHRTANPLFLLLLFVPGLTLVELTFVLAALPDEYNDDVHQLAFVD